MAAKRASASGTRVKAEPETGIQSSACKILVDALSNGMPGISPACGAALAEAAKVCLEDSAHLPGVTLGIQGELRGDCELDWVPPADPEQARRTWADEPEATEHGAAGVAVLVVEKKTGLVVVERSSKGTGFDYWLGAPEAAGTLFQRAERLEVSGIRKGGGSLVGARLRGKLSQLSRGGVPIPGYAVVVEFGRPQSHVGRP